MHGLNLKWNSIFWIQFVFYMSNSIFSKWNWHHLHRLLWTTVLQMFCIFCDLSPWCTELWQCSQSPMDEAQSFLPVFKSNFICSETTVKVYLIILEFLIYAEESLLDEQAERNTPRKIWFLSSCSTCKNEKKIRVVW